MAARPGPMLSKSRFVAGLQCPLRLWHQCFNPGLATETTAVQQALFDSGHEVGRLATRRYSGGVLIEEDHRRHREAMASTRAAMGEPGVGAIYEAAFLHRGVRVRADVLQRLERGRWNLIEVKSSAAVKPVHVPDLALQYYVLQGAGLDLDQALLLHLNRDYLYEGGRLDLGALFRASDLTRESLARQDWVGSRIQAFEAMLEGVSPPEIEPSRHCRNPHECEFYAHCTRDVPEHWVLDLSGITAARLQELQAAGIRDIRDIPETFPLTRTQARMRRCVLRGEAYRSSGLGAELRDVEYPLHFLDFETVSPAIPRYSGTRPYQVLPFQWSDHVVTKGGALEHREFLWDQDTDPREGFAESLLAALAERGTVFVYADYEKRIVRALAEDLPGLRERLLALPARFRDLCAFIRQHYYHPGFHGSFSLKSVLPALVPGMDYRGLGIQEGALASLQYLRMFDPAAAPEERAGIRRDLLAYCGHDTLAMVRIREELLKSL